MKKSDDGVLLLVLQSFSTGTGAALKKDFRKMKKIVVMEYFLIKSCRFVSRIFL